MDEAGRNRCVVVGCGHMGLAILQGMREAAPQAKLLGVDENSSRRRDTDRAGIEFSNGFTAAPDDVVVLAIPPQRFPAFAMQGGTGLGEAGVIVSVMAGITVRQISQACGNGRVVRAIPNTPAEVAESMTVFFAAEGLPERVRRAAVEVIESFGLALEVSDESQIDDATAICGGGPAFVALVAHAFGEFAVGCGFSETAASNLVSQVIGGTGRLLTRSGKPPMQICRDVMTPNGTTERGIAVLDAAGIVGIFKAALLASADRSRALSASASAGAAVVSGHVA